MTCWSDDAPGRSPGFSLNPGGPVTTISPTTDVVYIEPLSTDAERDALADFVAGYSLTRDAYAIDLRQYTGWCQRHGLHQFKPAARTSNASGVTWGYAARPAPLSPAGCAPCLDFYRYAVEEELLEDSPVVHARRPRFDCESHAIGLDRNEVGSLLVATGLGAANEAP